MKNVIEIIRNDLKEIFKNPLAIGILLAIIIIPSLFAILNIEACWDMYDKTDAINFAIANEDEGYVYNGENLSLGNELEKQLKNNNNFNWTFVTKETLEKGVNNGTYYAGIIIPKNFSEKIASITTDNPQQAVLQYKVNIKSNPIANKLTDSGAKAVYNQMNGKIIEYINLAAYEKLGDLYSGLQSGSTQLSSGAVKLSSGAAQVSDGASEVSDGASKVSEGAGKLKSTTSKLSDASGSISSGANKVSQAAGSVSSGSSQIKDSADKLSASVDTSKLPEGQVKQVVESSLSLANASSTLADGSKDVASASVKLANSSVKLSNGASKIANSSATLAGGSKELSQGSLSLAAGSTLLADSAVYALYSAAGSLSQAAGSLSDVTGVDEDSIGDYFYSPIKLEKDEIYPASNFGSQLAPFYLVLSMWIGAVITCVMLNTGKSTNTKYRPLEMYFAKLGLFLIMAILETSISLTGCFAAGIDINNPVMFILTAFTVAVIFMTFIYSLISALGQAGKGIAVILLVLQISSCGGVYPIQLMNPFFQTINPYMPMTHAITMVRESTLGLLWSNYLPSLEYLIIFIIITVILAVIIKNKADDKTQAMEDKLKKTGIF